MKHPLFVWPSAPPGLSWASRIADYSVMVLALVFGGGSFALFAWADRPTLVPMHLSPAVRMQPVGEGSPHKREFAAIQFFRNQPLLGNPHFEHRYSVVMG